MLEERIFKEYQEAMKARDALKISVLSFLRSEILNTALAKKKNSLTDEEIIAVIRKQIKARQDAVAQFINGNRQDLADKETKEIEILKTYLPPELPPEELNRIIEEVVVEAAAKDIKDMNRVMKEVSLRVAGRAEGKLISDLVRQRLIKAP